MSRRSRLSALSIAALTLLIAQSSIGSEPISLELIMSNPAWIGATPENPYWSIDGKSIYFEEPRAEDDFNDLLRLSLQDPEGEPLRIDGADWGTIDVPQRDFSEDRRRAVFERSGDLFIRSVDGELTQLTRTSARESRPSFLNGDQSIVFRRDDQFFVRDLKSGLEHQPVELRAQDDPDDDEEPDDFLSLQQSRLFEVVRDHKGRKDRREARDEARREADPTAPPKPIYLGEGTTVLNGELSPNGRFLVLLTTPSEPAEGRGDHMPSFVSADGYVEVRDVRPKVGTIPEPDQALMMVDVLGAEARPIELSVLPGIAEDPLADLKEVQKESRKDDDGASDAADSDVAQSDDSSAASDEKEPRSVEIEVLRWSPSGERLAVQAHSYDNKDRWIAITDGGGELKPVHHLHLDSWINWSYNELGWLDDNRLWFLSEESGWSQLYLYQVDSGKTQRLSRGDAVVSNPTPSPDHRFIYFTANPEHPGRYDTFRVDVATGDIEQVSSLGGRTTFELSPTGQHLLLTHSSLLQPDELYLAAVGADQGSTSPEPRRLTHTVSEQFAAIDWVEPQIVEVPSSHHDRPIYSRFYASRHPDRLRGEDGKVPAVVFVHGAGYLQNSHKGFSGYFREFMFHTWLSEHGYHVLDMDYRASAGYGVEWRTAIYRQMGTPELEDLEDGVAWLVANHDVDVERAGVYGGSYGGFMTMMALFKAPELFAAGAALRPVTDWAHYNHPYTSNILNTPDVDPEAYARSSPIEFADGLQNHLLICAPMLDDNVFFQDTVRLTQRFIELGQTNFEVALYPVEPHGFRRPSSWLDEYRRIFRLFEQKLAP